MERARASDRKTQLSLPFWFCLVADDSCLFLFFSTNFFLSLSFKPIANQSEAPREVKHDLEQHNKIDEVGRRGEEAAAAAAPAEEAAETAVATSENESIAAAVHRAPAVGDRRAASPAHHHREVVAAAALGGGGGGGGGEAVGTHGENELPREAFKAHSEEVMKAHGGSSASKHSPLASKQPPVVDVGMQNKQMD